MNDDAAGNNFKVRDPNNVGQDLASDDAWGGDVSCLDTSRASR